MNKKTIIKKDIDMTNKEKFLNGWFFNDGGIISHCMFAFSNVDKTSIGLISQHYFSMDGEREIMNRQLHLVVDSITPTKVNASVYVYNKKTNVSIKFDDMDFDVAPNKWLNNIKK